MKGSSSFDVYMQRESHKSQMFEDLYESFSDALFRYCFFRIGEREDAIDIVEESFTRLWAQIRSGKEIPNLKPYLLVICRNMIIDWYRKKKPLSLNALMEGSEFEAPFDIADPDALNIEIAVDGKRALSAIKEVSLAYREVLYLRFVEDMPPRDIAEILNITGNIVSIRITRGLQELRQVLRIENK